MYNHDKYSKLLNHERELISNKINTTNIYDKFSKHRDYNLVIFILTSGDIDMYPLYDFLNNTNLRINIDNHHLRKGRQSRRNRHSKGRQSRRNRHSKGRRSRRNSDSNSHSEIYGSTSINSRINMSGGSSDQTNFCRRYIVPIIFNIIYTWMMNEPERWQEGDTVYHNGQVIHLSHIHPNNGIVSSQTVISPNMMATIIYVIYNFIREQMQQ